MTHSISPKLTNRQIEFIKGTVLGGSSIVKPNKGKNCYLSMRNKNVEWIRYKATVLQNLASETPMTKEKTNRWHSKCYPIFNQFRNMFYVNDKRQIDIEHLSTLKDMALAVWYCDCGCFKKNNIMFNTHIWGASGTEIIKKYFNYLGYNPTIIKERGSHRIILDRKSSMDIMKFISPHMPFLSN